MTVEAVRHRVAAQVKTPFYIPSTRRDADKINQSRLAPSKHCHGIRSRKPDGVYDPDAPLSRASTIPSTWYTHTHLPARAANRLQPLMASCRAQRSINEPGDFVTADIAGEPVVIVRGSDHRIRDSLMCAVITQLRS